MTENSPESTKKRPKINNLNLNRRRKSKNLSHSNFNSKTDRSSHSSTNLNTVDDISLKDLSRDKFNHSLLCNMGWWPDEIYTFIQILKFSYEDFIASYIGDASIFDEPLRRVIYFTTQKKYIKITEISKFAKSGNFQIPDDYLNHIINADPNNFESATVHQNLIDALEKLLSIGNISEGDIVLKKESEDLIRIFVSIYRIIKSYHHINNTLIIIIKAASRLFKLDINLITILEETLSELEGKVFIHFRTIHDKKLFNMACIYRDLLLFGLSQSTQFDFIMNYTHSSEYAVLDKLSPLNNHPIFTAESMTRIQYAYKYYLTKIYVNNNGEKSRLNIIDRPTYFINSNNDESKHKFKPFELGNRSLSEHFGNNRSRKYSMESSSKETSDNLSESMSPRNVHSIQDIPIRNRVQRSGTVIEYLDVND